MKHHRLVLLMACLFLLLTTGCSSRQKSAADTESQEEQQALATAEVYRDIYTNVYPGDQSAVILTDNTMQEILSRLGTEGLVAVDFSNRFQMENSDLVLQFLEEKEAGTDTGVTIYQICWDGGFICHDLTYKDGNLTVVLTSLAWLSEGPYALTGDIPTIMYSDKYMVTDLCYTADGYLEYEYDMPDNPPGSNHDGHIDTTYRLAVSTA